MVKEAYRSYQPKIPNQNFSNVFINGKQPLLRFSHWSSTIAWHGAFHERQWTTVNRPLALRGHVTNVSFKQRVGILLMPKIVRARKNYLTPEIWEETHLREIFGTLVCIGRHVGGHALALQHGGQNYFLLISCSTFHSYAQMRCKRYHIIFSTFSLNFKCKICVQREVIDNIKNHILVTWPFTNLLILRKWCGFEKPNHHYFEIWPTNRFKRPGRRNVPTSLLNYDDNCSFQKVIESGAIYIAK